MSADIADMTERVALLTLSAQEGTRLGQVGIQKALESLARP